MSLDTILHRREPTPLQLFTRNPLIFLSQKLYQLYGGNLKSQLLGTTVPIRVVCISDTHNHHKKLGQLPDGDILIHAGDLTQSGTLEEVHDALQWLASQPHPHKIFIAGNHDRALCTDDDSQLKAFSSLTYLERSSTTLCIRERVLHVYGSPFTPAHGSWAFQYPRAEAAKQWDDVPADADVIVTHGPPAHHADRGAGCAGLLAALWRVRPRLHVCGHAHAGRGVEVLPWTRGQAAHERICAGVGGWWDLLAALWGVFAWAWSTGARGTTLVNAASLGGFRDEQARGAIVVNI